MKPLTAEWIAKAEGDLAVARREIETPKPVYEAVCYHAQQCIEKYLKALIAENGLTPPKTHDLVVLLNQTGQERNFQVGRELLARVSVYAVEIRYPGENVLDAEAKESLELAGKIRSLARELLGLKKENE